MIAIISLPGISMASSKSLQQAIANIKIWHKGEQRAPHKPLLLLYVLAGYLNGHPRLFDYGSEIYEPLHSLLERFGPQRSQYRPDMPFWRLQGDGFWQLRNAELCSTAGSSRQPPVKELTEHRVAGGFDEQHYALVTGNKKLINTLAQQILKRTSPRVFRKKLLTSWVLISSKSVNSATRYFAKMYYALINTSARYVALICATTTPPSRWKRRI